jgi:hypothetical protein
MTTMLDPSKCLQIVLAVCAADILNVVSQHLGKSHLCSAHLFHFPSFDLLSRKKSDSLVGTFELRACAY